MKVSELIVILQALPEGAEINFADGNFGGPGDEMNELDIDLSDPQNVLVRPPYCPPLED